MRIAMTVDPAHHRRWHARLVDGLRQDGHLVSLTAVRDEASRPIRGLDLLLRFERLVFPAQGSDLFEPLALESADAEPVIDLHIDLGTLPRSTEAWSLSFDGIRGEAGLVSALLDGRSPSIRLEGSEGPVACGEAALENPRLLGLGLDAVLLRAIGLCRRAVADRAKGNRRSSLSATRETGAAPSGRVMAFMLRGLTERISGRLARMAGSAHCWQTGWRALGPGDSSVQATLTWPDGGYNWLPDDGQRIYADPFLFAAEGRTFLFVEDYPYSTNRGIISTVELTPDGPTGTPRPVLEAAVHLSYPTVFARDGAIWMIPETHGARRIDLYRADPFPDRWVLHRTLVADVAASDATLLEHEGQLYLFATTNDGGGSTWDQLTIYCAESLDGPWTVHPDSPAVIDASAARPAGFTFHRGRELIRPVQDCRGGYGAALTFCRIDELSRTRFRQTVLSRLAPDPRWHASGAHTLNVGAGFEVVDRMAPRR